jgi:hypothetical protein
LRSTGNTSRLHVPKSRNHTTQNRTTRRNQRTPASRTEGGCRGSVSVGLIARTNQDWQACPCGAIVQTATSPPPTRTGEIRRG